MIVETYIARGQCVGCGAYLWTNPNSSNIVCECTVGEIENDVPYGCDEVADEAAFKQAAADYRGCAVGEITVEQG